MLNLFLQATHMLASAGAAQECLSRFQPSLPSSPSSNMVRMSIFVFVFVFVERYTNTKCKYKYNLIHKNTKYNHPYHAHHPPICRDTSNCISIHIFLTFLFCPLATLQNVKQKIIISSGPLQPKSLFNPSKPHQMIILVVQVKLPNPHPQAWKKLKF